MREIITTFLHTTQHALSVNAFFYMFLLISLTILLIEATYLSTYKINNLTGEVSTVQVSEFKFNTYHKIVLMILI